MICALAGAVFYLSRSHKTEVVAPRKAYVKTMVFTRRRIETGEIVTADLIEEGPAKFNSIDHIPKCSIAIGHRSKGKNQGLPLSYSDLDPLPQDYNGMAVNSIRKISRGTIIQAEDVEEIPFQKRLMYLDNLNSSSMAVGKKAKYGLGKNEILGAHLLEP